ncbi:TPA: hypothetical protein N0F65_001141 [Lagenidium giganteum]|uniref:FYVE-type domain-containing protein n=1 Tax=Lagenidium giganteum TaxID=4803 RepID=A0AAV2YWQ3_9STRA|nr:TPA: hypothetical protein N0F65_001141 [Lagenidium giganteum]
MVDEAGIGASAGSSRRDHQFPLSAQFFPRLKMTPEHKQSLVARTQQRVQAAIATAHWQIPAEYDSDGWKLFSGKKHFRETGIRAYSRKDKRRGKLEFRCLGRVALGMDKVLDACYADNTIEFRNKMAVLLDNFLDAAVLEVLARQTPKEPHQYVGINWFATSHRGLLRKNRDFCCLRSTGVTYDDEKQKIGFVSMESMDVPECPSLEKLLGLVRTQLSAVLLLKQHPEMQPSLLAMAHHMFTSFVRGLNMVLDVQCIARQTDVNRAMWVPNAHRKFCFLCNKRFSLLRTRHHCRSCGEVMCRDCEFVQPMSSLDRESFAFPGKELKRYCKKCVGAARTEIEHSQQQHLPLGLLYVGDDLVAQSNVSEPLTMDSLDRASDLSSTDSRRCVSETSGAISEYVPPPSRGPFAVGSRRQIPSPVLDSPLAVHLTRRSDFIIDLTRDDTFNHVNSTPPRRRRESELASRLWEISCKAQETLETTKRTSCMMSDAGSTTRLSCDAFQNLDRNIAEQADLLNVIGLVSTGRTYMESSDVEAAGLNAGCGGVRMSQTSIQSADRFEVINV